MADFVISAALAMKDNLTAPMRAAIHAIRKLRGEADDADDSINNLNRSLEGSNVALGVVTSGFSGATAAIAPLVAGAGALGASLVAAGAGVAAYGIVAKTALTGIFDASEEVAKLEEKIAQADSAKERIAAQKELAAVYADMSQEQRGALKNLQEFKGFWEDFTKQFEKPIFNAFSEGLKGAQSVMTALKPTIDGVSQVVVKLMQDFNASLQGPTMKGFFDWLSISAPQSISNFGQIFGNAFGGVMNLLRAFSPLSSSVENGLLGMMTKFREWAAGLSQSQGFKNFIEFAKTNTPVLLNILKNVFVVAGNLSTALSPLGTTVLFIVGKITDVLRNILVPAFKFIGPVISDTISVISNGINSTVSIIKSKANLILPVFNTIVEYGKQVFQTISQWWQRDGGMIIQAAKNVVNFVIAAFQFLTPVWKVIWVVIKTVVIGIWENIKGVISGAIGIITNIISFFGALFTGNWRRMWESIKGLVSSALQFVWNLVQLTFLGRLLGPIRAGMGVIKTVITASWNFVKSIFVNTWNFLKGLLSARMSTIISALENGMNFLRTIFWRGWDFIKGIFSRTLNSIRENVTKVFGDVKKTLGEWVDKAKQFAKDFLKGIIDGWNEKLKDVIVAAKKIWEAIKKVFTDEDITVTPQIQGPPIPPGYGGRDGDPATPYAWGGILTRPHLGLVAEDGPEAVIPLGGDKRQRGLDLYNQVGKILGADQVRSYATGTVSTTNNIVTTTTKHTPVHVHYHASSGQTDSEFQRFFRQLKSSMNNMG